MKSFYALMGGLLLMACGGGSGAKDALQDYMDAMQNKDYEAFVDGIKFSETDPAKLKESREALVALIKESSGRGFSGRGLLRGDL